MKKNNKGFTLIELLVVIAIIGILASVILASLNVARGKGKSGTIKQDLANARAQASLYYNDNSLSYSGVCANNVGATKGIKDFHDGAKAIVGTAATATYCNSSSADWVLASQLPTGGYWCVDSRGVARDKTAGGVAYTAVSGASPAAANTTSAICN